MKSAEEAVQVCKEDLMESLDGLAKHIFGNVETRWIDAYFPFTEPSIEMEVKYNDKWLEILGCGVIHPDVMKNGG